MEAPDHVERTAREAYGRLVAILAARSRDIMAAEDALHDAFLAALLQWPHEGVPQRPEAWIISVAKRRLMDSDRRKALFRDMEHRLEAAVESDPVRTNALPDDRLELMLVCAHPAIDASIRAPLILQTVLGLNAEAIASAFLMAPTTMGQRLVRAKQKIRDAGMTFDLPGADVLEARLDALLDAIYAAFGTAWEDLTSSANGSRDLDRESRSLATAILDRLPDHAETLGLLSLMHYASARRPARRDGAGHFVPLQDQDITRWDREQIALGEQLLRRAARSGTLGRYQLEAAIQSAHITARLTGREDPIGVLALYEGLLRVAPSIGAQVAHAAAFSKVHGPVPALERLAALDPSITANYQAFHALRADLLHRSGRFQEAREAYQRAIGLSDDPAVRAFLMERMERT